MLDTSVVINTRNHPDELRLCLAALEAQTLAPERWEIVVVDDGSDDTATVGIVEAYSGESQCRAIPREHIGRATTRNVGVSAARGNYVLFLGDDVLAGPDLLEQHLKAQKRYDPVAVIGQTEWTPECGSDILRQWMDNRAVWDINDSLDAGFEYFYTGNASIERRLLLDLGGFDEQFIVCGWEDIDLSYRLDKWGIRTIYYARAFATHNHPDMTLDDLCRREYEKAFSAFYFFEKWAGEAELESLRFWKGTVCDLKSPSLICARFRAFCIRLMEAFLPSLSGLGGMYALMLNAHQVRGLKAGECHYTPILKSYRSGVISRSECTRSFQGLEVELNESAHERALQSG